MPQFDSGTFISQIFWLVVFSLTVFFGFYTFIIPRHLRNLQLRQQKLHELYQQIDDSDRETAALKLHIKNLQETTETLARTQFNEARHLLDSQDQHAREALIRAQRQQWLAAKKAQALEADTIPQWVPLVAAELSQFLKRVSRPSSSSRR